jgi:hypothetical protein
MRVDNFRGQREPLSISDEGETAKMAKTPRQTSDSVSSLAGKVLADPASSKIAKRLAASALTQGDSPREGTSPKVAKAAAGALARDRSSKTVKTLAGSVLSQKPPAPKAKSAPTKSAPTKSAPAKSAPAKSAPAKSAPAKSAPARKR